MTVPALRPLRLLIAGGGTGGHLYPGIAVAEELRRRDPSTQVSFVGTARGLESKVVPATSRGDSKRINE